MNLERLIRLLLDQPVVALFVVVWIVGVIGGAVKKAGRAAKSTAKSAPPARRRPPSPQEVAAEMRRILEQEPPPPVQKEVKRRPALAPAIETGPRPLGERQMARLESHVQSNVGRSLEKRSAPTTGQVGAHQLGTLGGRLARIQRRRRPGSYLVDLSDLPRAMVLREVIDRPLSLRVDW